MLTFTVTIVSLLAAVALFALRAIDELPFAPLFSLSLVFMMAGVHFDSHRQSAHTRITAAMFFLAYFLYCFPTAAEDWMQLVAAFLRSLCAYHLTWGLLTIVLAGVRTGGEKGNRVAQAAARILLATFFLGLRGAARLRKLMRKPPPAPVIEPAPAPLSKAVRMRIRAKLAKEDFDSEVAALENLPLDEDEREVLILEAKQRLLQKLAELPRS